MSAAADRIPDVSVIVPHYEDLDNLQACLAMLRRQTLPAERFEVIVADNRSPAGLDAVRAVTGDGVRLVDNPEKGAGPTRNAGAALARGGVLAFLDSDCRPEPGWLEAGLAAANAHGVAGGHVDVLAQNSERLAPVEAFEMVFAFDNARYIAEKGFSVSANLFVRRDVWARVGGFRNGMSEDVDWCWRARDAGFPVVYAPQARVGHPARRNWEELAKKWRRLSSETFLLNRDRRFARARWLAQTWATLLSPVPHVVTVLRSPNLRRPGDRLGAARVLFAIRAFRFVEGHRNLFGRG